MDQKFNETILHIISRDQRYQADAYEFVNAAVTYTAKKLARNRKPRGKNRTTKTKRFFLKIWEDVSYVVFVFDYFIL